MGTGLHYLTKDSKLALDELDLEEGVAQAYEYSADEVLMFHEL